MKRAILSDIHGNLEALTAVLADIDAQGIKAIYCLGDIIGYGPNPRECADRAMSFDLCVLGNHDQGALFDPEGFSSGAERAIFWTRQQLELPDEDAAIRQKRWHFLCELPRQCREEEILFVHGSARNPLNEYVFPEDVYNPRKLGRIFSLILGTCFQGHTHVPGVFTEDCRFVSPVDAGGSYELNGQKVMVNVGSVGQPRDSNPNASYVVLEDDAIHFRRVSYDIDATVGKIYDIADLDNFLGDRLREGR
ncbi:MAG: phosphoesterase [Planctomycetaceae bacterium]|nr:phosphoesterase [Planctomycetaceae bacterium]